jgi:hypothetical protein
MVPSSKMGLRVDNVIDRYWVQDLFGQYEAGIHQSWADIRIDITHDIQWISSWVIFGLISLIDTMFLNIRGLC